VAESSHATFPVWPHLENLDRVLKDMPGFLKGSQVPNSDGVPLWYITEKLHGFNARFGKTEDGMCWAGGRNQVLVTGHPETWPEDGTQGFLGYAKMHVQDLQPGETMFGEWAGKGIQKGIDYGEKTFYAFGLMVNGKLVGWHSLAQFCDLLCMKTVPLIWLGSDVPDLGTLNTWRTAKSVLDPEHVREGICIASSPPCLDTYGHVLIAKFKSPEFSERAYAKADRVMPDLTTVNAFVADYATMTRLEHVLAIIDEDLRVQQGNAEGREDALLVENTGAVMRAMYADVVREGASDFEALSKDDQRLVGSALNRATKILLDQARYSLAN